MLDLTLGLLANFFQVSFAVAALSVFLIPRQRKAKIANMVQRYASLVASRPWFAGLLGCCLLSARTLSRIYGPEPISASQRLREYLTDESLQTSLAIARGYLLFAPLVVGCLFLLLGISSNAPAPARVEAAVVLIICLAMLRFQSGFGKQLHQRYASLDRVRIALQVSLLVALVAVSPFGKLGELLESARMSGLTPLVAGPIAFALLLAAAIARLSRLGAHLLYLGPIFILATAPLIFASLESKRLVLELIKNPVDLWTAIRVLMDVACWGALARFALHTSGSGPKADRRIRWALLAYIFLCFRPTVAFVIVTVIARDVPARLESVALFLLALPFLLQFLMINAVVVIYANAACDWISVAVTRFLLREIRQVQSVRTYFALVLLDVSVALLLVGLSVLAFGTLLHLYVVYLGEDAQSVLIGFRSTFLLDPVGSAPGPLSIPYAGGRLIGFLALLFGATAVIPTALHLALQVLFLLSKVLLPLISVPATLLVERISDGSEGERSAIDRTLDSVIFGALVISMLVPYLAWKLALIALGAT